jgi:hypothetical protein
MKSQLSKVAYLMWKSIVVAYSEETFNPEDGIWDVECKQLRYLNI